MIKPRVQVGATYSFEAAHQLPLLPEGHKCRRLHGHNYRLEVSVSGPLDERGFVMDYAELDAIVRPLVDQLDHRLLNEVVGLDNPTSEVIALWFRERIATKLGTTPTVRLWETPHYWVEA